MTYLSDEERALVRSVSPQSARAKRAEAIVNPASGLANDYLNLFNEIVMLVEQLPMMPELFEDIQNWRPVSYRDYFRNSVLPGRASALEQYELLEGRFRRRFEAVVEELDRRSTGSVAAVRRQFKAHGEDETALAIVCERAGSHIRETLDQATMLVNHGAVVSGDAVQRRTDLLLAALAKPAA